METVESEPSESVPSEYRINVWRINPHSLHLNLLVECDEFDGIEALTSDKNELVVKTKHDVILFNLETGDQIWKIRWDYYGRLHYSHQIISSNKIKEKIHIWKMSSDRRCTDRYGQFQLIRLIFEKKIIIFNNYIQSSLRPTE